MQAQTQTVQQISLEGKIQFSGGTDFGPYLAYVNPTQAIPQTDSEVTKLHWWITEAKSDIILYDGTSHNIESALIKLQEDGRNGEYILNINLECENGASHRMYSNFYINGKIEN